MSHRLAAALAALVVVLSVALALRARERRGGQGLPSPAEARVVVLEYLRALEARDRHGIEKLVPGDYDAGGDIDQRLQQFGGARAHEAEIRITADFSPEVVSANIRTVGPDGRQGRLPVSDIRRPTE